MIIYDFWLSWLDFYEGKIVLVHRGECRFDRKALIAQQAGARLVIVIEVNDDPLQRLGNLDYIC